MSTAMGINNIQLTPQLIADLYSNVLIDLNTSVMPDKKGVQEKAPLKVLGSNAKQILIVVDNKEVAFLNDADFNFLSNILKACNVSIGDVAIINWQNAQKRTTTEIFEQLTSKLVLLFNVSPVDFGLPLDFPHYQTQKFDKRTYLFAPTLSTLENNIEQKKLLWSSLQRLFELK